MAGFTGQLITGGADGSKPDGNVADDVADDVGQATIRLFFEQAAFQMGVTELTEDEDMILVAVNHAAAARIGLTPAQAQGKRISELGLPGPRRGVWLDQYLQAWKEQRPVEFEQPSLLPGANEWWSVTLAWIGHGPSGRPRFSYVVQDITQRKRDEATAAALQLISEAAHTAATLPKLFDRIHEVIGQLLPARNFFVALYDRARDELSFPYYVDEFDSAPPPQSLDDGTLAGRVVKSGEALLFNPDTPNEGLHQKDIVVGTPSLDWLGVPLKWQGATIGALVVQSYGGDVRYVTQDRDLLEFVSGQVASAIARKQAEQATVASEARFRLLFEQNQAGVFRSAPDGRILQCNAAFARMLGFDSIDEAQRTNARTLYYDETDRESYVAEMRANGAVTGLAMRFRRKDGSELWAMETVNVIRGEGGEPEVFQGTVVDFTGHKQAEAALKLSGLLERERSQVLELVAQNQPLDAVLASVARMLENQRPGLRACILRVRGGLCRLAVAPSLPGDALTLLDSLPAAVGYGSFGAAAERGIPVQTSHVADSVDWVRLRDWAARHAVESSLSSPLLSAGGEVLGTLSLFCAQPWQASAADRELLESACHLATVAIEHRELTDQLSHQAHHDALTGLPNRLLFQDRLAHAIAQAARHGTQVAVLYMDLDRFKHINDTLGHASGDALLRQVAERLDGCVRKSDTLARLGGDEFTVVLNDLVEVGDAMRAGRALVECMRVPFRVDGRDLYASISLGISIYPQDSLDAADLMAHADVAMYRAKETGRDTLQWFAPEMNLLAREQLDLENDLRRALAQDELELHYQPQYDGDGRILALEALLRWQHPVLGSVPPSRFIPLAEQCGLIVPVGEWALRRACAQAERWRRAGHAGLRMSVNVSAVQFKRDDWVDTVRSTLRDSGLDADALELEITESLLLQSANDTLANLIELRELGVGVAIDDFGTGYSSLSYLHTLPISTLKIDQSFVCDIDEGPREHGQRAPIVRTIIALAKNLGMAVVAEGVETTIQRDLLRSLGCDLLQGFLLSPPCDAAEAGRLLEVQARTALLHGP